MEDETIVDLYWKRDAAAISATDEAYGAYCRALAFRILGSREDAEECANDTWVRLWNAIPPQRPCSLRMFAAKIARNLAFHRYEARTAAKRGGGELPLVLDELAECLPDAQSVEGACEAKELAAFVREFVKNLPARDADVFLRRYFFAETARDIAARRGMTENHVQVILSRTRKKLRAQLEQEGFR